MSGRPALICASGEGRWIDWRGTPFRLLSTGDQTDHTMTVGVGLLDIGDGRPPHIHSREDVGVYVLEGKVEFIAGNETARLTPGEFINVRPGTALTVTNVGLSEARLLMINAPAGFDAYQLEVSKEVDGPFESYEPAEEDHDAIVTAALGHGIAIELDLDSSEFSDPPEATVRHASEGAVIDTVGDRYRFLADSSETGGRYAIWHATISPGGGPPPHRHSKEEEAFFVLSGEIEVICDGQEATLQSGGFAHLPKGSAHAFKNRSTSPAEMLIIVAPGGLEGMFRKSGKVADLEKQPSAPTEEELARLPEIAAKYGVEILG